MRRARNPSRAASAPAELSAMFLFRPSGATKPEAVIAGRHAASKSVVVALEGSCTCLETFLRRDSHGGFGIFFMDSGAGVVRGIEPLSNGLSDGRDKLDLGDTIIRVQIGAAGSV